MVDSFAGNPAISLGVKVPQPDTNPLGALGGFAAIQNQLNQATLFRQTFAARQRAGEIIAGSDPNNPEAALTALQQDPLVSGYAPQIISDVRGWQSTLVGLQGTVAGQGRSGFEAFAKMLGPAISDPSQIQSIAGTAVAGIPPGPGRTSASNYINAFVSSLTHGLPLDNWANLDAGARNNIRTVMGNRIIGPMVAAGVGPESLRMFTGTPTTMDVGGQIFAGVQAPPQAGGGFTPATVAGKSLSPQITTVGGLPVVMGGGGGGGTGGGGGIAAPVPSGPASGPGTGAGGPGPGPAASTPGGMPQVLSTGTYTARRAADMADYQKGLDSRVEVGGQIMQTVAEARDALANFKPGGGAEVYTRLGQLAQAFGADPKLVDRIANGDLGASLEFQKLMVNTTMGQIREQLQGVGASRLSQMEFLAFNRNNPNIDTDPRAIEKIFNFWTKLYTRDAHEQSAMNDYLQKGGNISNWPAEWQNIARKSGYIPTVVTGAPGTTPSGPGTVQAPSGSLPAAARARLKEGVHTTFGNGQTWTLQNGNPVQVQ